MGNNREAGFGSTWIVMLMTIVMGLTELNLIKEDETFGPLSKCKGLKGINLKPLKRPCSS